MCSDLPVLRIDNFKKINKSILNLNELKLEDKDFLMKSSVPHFG